MPTPKPKTANDNYAIKKRSEQSAALNKRAKDVSKVAGNVATPGRGGVKTVEQAKAINANARNAAAKANAGSQRYRKNVAQKKP